MAIRPQQMDVEVRTDDEKRIVLVTIRFLLSIVEPGCPVHSRTDVFGPESMTLGELEDSLRSDEVSFLLPAKPMMAPGAMQDGRHSLQVVVVKIREHWQKLDREQQGDSGENIESQP